MEFKSSLLNELDDLIKKGQGDSVRTIIRQISPSTVPRELSAAMAKVALRVGEPTYALSLLRPLILSDKLLDAEVTPDEWIQYGMCLKQLGASDHALKIFQSVASEKNPEVLLYESITLFTQWRYQEAIPKLREYIEHPALSAYQKDLGQLNLISALIIVGELVEAEKLLHPLAQRAQKNERHLLRGNGLELMAQIAVYKAQYDQAEIYLQEASQFIKSSAPSYQLFLEKWSAVVQLFKTKGSLASLQNLNWVRERAIELTHWETVRDCDFFFAISKKDRHLYHRLYFGTPHLPYRARLKHFFQDTNPLPPTFDWRGNTAHQPKVGSIGVLDIHTPRGDQNLRLIKALSTDFYAPMKPFTLFLHMFPEEKLDPEAALPRIYSAVSRAKKWLKEKNIPIEIAHSDAGYHLHWTGPYILRIPSEIQLQKSIEKWQETLHHHFQNRVFSSLEAAEVLGLSQRSFLRTLQESLQVTELEVLGHGRSTRYRFKSQFKKAA